MFSVFKSENYRLRKSKELFGMALILILMTVLSTILTWCLNNLSIFKSMQEEGTLTVLLGKEYIFDTFTEEPTGILFGILSLVMVSSLVTKIYQSGVAKQLAGSGIPRSEIILGQFFSMTQGFFYVALLSAFIAALAKLVNGGVFGLSEGNIGRFLLSVVGMLLVVANETALYMLIAHLTGSMGGAIIGCLACELGLSTVVSQVAALLKIDAINTYYYGTVQGKVIEMSGPIKDQLINMVILIAYTVVFIILTQIVFKQKDIK